MMTTMLWEQHVDANDDDDGFEVVSDVLTLVPVKIYDFFVLFVVAVAGDDEDNDLFVGNVEIFDVATVAVLVAILVDVVFVVDVSDVVFVLLVTFDDSALCRHLCVILVCDLMSKHDALAPLVLFVIIWHTK